jgi:hypothetical protein
MIKFNRISLFFLLPYRYVKASVNDKNIILLILALYSSLGFAKKLVINKCQLADGTISYQENRCQNQALLLKNKNSGRKPQLAKANNEPIKYSVRNKQLSSVNVKAHSITKIGNKVKGYQVSLDALRQWKIVNKVFNNKLLHIKFIDNKIDNELLVRIDFIYPDNKIFSTQELTEIVHLVGSRFVSGSQEGQVNAYSINTNNGKGVMANFTQSSVAPDYKYSSKGAIFKGDWLIQFTLLSNNLTSHSHEFALQSLFKTLVIKKI